MNDKLPAGRVWVLLLLPAVMQPADFAYPLPRPSEFVLRKDIAYGKWSGGDLFMDIYEPTRMESTARLSVIVFLNTFGFPRRGEPMYTGWAKVAAAHGFAAVNPDSHPDGIEQDFDQLLSYLSQHATNLHIDADQVGVWAGSGNVTQGFPLVENPKRTAVKAAVMCYGLGEVSEFRPELPVLLVRAGLDQAALNRAIGEFAVNAVAHNAPLTLLNYSGGHHAYELVDDNNLTHEVMDQTLRFFHAALTPKFQAALRSRIPEATAAAALQTRDFAKGVTLYAALVAAHPEDAGLALKHGEALLGARRYREARAQFERVKSLGWRGPRDLGIPAAKACALDGDPEAAMWWLRTIPGQFLPSDLPEDPAFRTLRERADFQALFQK